MGPLVFGPKRYVDSASNLNEIPEVNLFLLTHNHYDHLSTRTIQKFPYKKAKVLAPLKLGKYFTNKPLLKIFFQNSLNLEDDGWKYLTQRWIIFFIFLALVNEIVWRTQTAIFWVNFKVLGLLIISFLFAISQVPIIRKYKIK